MTEPFDNNAHSLDGLEFFFESGLSSPFSTGDFVVLKRATDVEIIKYLGVIESAKIVSERFPRGINKSVSGLPYANHSSVTRSEGIKGSGRILGRIDTEKFRESSGKDSFHQFRIIKSSDDDIKKWSTYLTNRKEFSIGNFLNSQDIMVPLDSDNLSRHTFLSGQTGSGKSSAIKTILSRILKMEDKPIIIIFDLNSEYGDLCKEFNGGENIKFVNLCPEIKNKERDELIKIDFFQMDDEWKLSIIDIDPIEDPADYYYFCNELEQFSSKQANGSEALKIGELIFNLIFTSKEKKASRSGFAFDNIDLPIWNIWKSKDTRVLLDEVILGDYDLVNIDLGSIKTKIQKLAVASFILESLWKNRETKQKFLVVIDEAHNIIPRVESNLLSKNIINRMIDIAGEGRKYGLYLFLCSQQPSKIHENVLSLCNNLILLQTTSTMDLEYVYSKFSSIPKSFIDKARFLKQGEAIIGGPLVKTPVFMKIDYLKEKDEQNCVTG